MNTPETLLALLKLNPEGPWSGTVMLPHIGPCVAGFRVKGDAVSITDLWVSPSARGNGLGQKMLREICNLSDAQLVPLVLRVKPYDRSRGGHRTGLPPVALRAWYASFGFVSTGKFSGEEWMRRIPVTRPEQLDN